MKSEEKRKYVLPENAANRYDLWLGLGNNIEEQNVRRQMAIGLFNQGFLDSKSMASFERPSAVIKYNPLPDDYIEPLPIEYYQKSIQGPNPSLWTRFLNKIGISHRPVQDMR